MKTINITGRNIESTIKHICKIKKCSKEKLCKALNWGIKTMYSWIKNKKTPSSPYKEILELLYQNPNALDLNNNKNWLLKAFSKIKNDAEEVATIIIQNKAKQKLCSFIVSGSEIKPAFVENCELIEIESWINENTKFKTATIQTTNNN